MLVYRGDSSNNFQVNTYQNSRYGFPVLFFSTSLKTAKYYADFLSKQKGLSTGGHVYSFEIPYFNKEIDFEMGYSYSSHFRNLVFKLKNENFKSVQITRK